MDKLVQWGRWVNSDSNMLGSYSSWLMIMRNIFEIVYVQFADEPPQIITWNEFIEMVTLKLEVSDDK